MTCLIALIFCLGQLYFQKQTNKQRQWPLKVVTMSQNPKLLQKSNLALPGESFCCVTIDVRHLN